MGNDPTEGSGKSDRSASAGRAGRDRPDGDVAARTRDAVARADRPAQTREAMRGAGVGGVLNDVAQGIDPAAQPARAGMAAAPSAGLLAETGLTSAARAAVGHLGRAAAFGAGVVAGAAVLALTPTNGAPLNHVDMGQNLRATFVYDEAIGNVEVKVDGQWRGTGVVAQLAPGGIYIDRDALEARVGALDSDALYAPGIVYERTSGIDPALSSSSARARAAAGLQPGQQNWQAHHLVPFGVMKGMSPGFQTAVAASGWRMDSVENVIALPVDLATFTEINGSLPMHSGSHPNYDTDVRGLMAGIEAGYATKSPDQLRTELAAMEATMRGRILDRHYHRKLR